MTHLLDLKRIDRSGFSNFAICMAKTQKYFSDNEKINWKVNKIYGYSQRN